MSIIQLVEQSVFELRETPVLLDSDVALFYGVETKRVNEAVANNPDKFPRGYVLDLSQEEWSDLKSKLSSSNTSGHGGKRKLPKAFSEKGLYMLATILKSGKATETALAIVEAFARMRELQRGLRQLQSAKTDKEKESISRQTGEIIAELLEDDLDVSESETTLELNLAIVKFKHTVKKDRRKRKDR